MNRIDQVSARYERSAVLATNGIEIVAVGDRSGARVNAAVREVVALTHDDASGLCDDLLGAAKALRWRLITQPQPLGFNPALLRAASEAASEAAELRAAVAPNVRHALAELVAAARAVDRDPPLGHVLLESIQDVGTSSCVVVAANSSAAAGLEGWLAPFGVVVRSAGQLLREQVFVEQAYAVGPPRFFSSSLVTAPMTEAVSFLLPAWFGDRSIPRSALATLAEGAVEVKGRIFSVGETSEPEASTVAEAVTDEDLLPQAVWIAPNARARAPRHDEVTARRVLLSGGYAILLDDGERIRAVDPAQPSGERVTTVDVDAVSPGTYLLLRDGETERQVLYDAALKLMGVQASAVEASQARWKEALQSRLDQRGHTAVVRELAKVGLRTVDRVQAWTEPMLVRPQSSRDFQLLLQWLDIPLQPAYMLATALRKKRAQASADIADELEAAVDAADMALLERDGHLHLDVEAEGFRGVIATRVLALSPDTEIVSRNDARVLIEDRGAKWLE